jgi:hypothetical protein
MWTMCRICLILLPLSGRIGAISLLGWVYPFPLLALSVPGPPLPWISFQLLGPPELWSGVFTQPQVVSIRAPLIYVDGPCLIVIHQPSPRQLRLSISDIELDLSDHPGQARNKTIILEGTWRMSRATAGVQLSPYHGRTRLTFLVSHGKSFNVALERVG